MIMESSVFTPWPTSGFFAMIVNVPSGLTFTNAVGTKAGAGSAEFCAIAWENGSK